MTIALEPRRPLLLNLITEHKPFYLLSAACMLAGCMALTNTTTYSPITLDRLVPLIATLNLYELVVIALALVLVRRRGLVRDGRLLLILQAMFLVDITFLNAEIVTLDLTAGLIANGIIFALALVKLGVVLWLLDVRLPGFKVVFIVLQLIVLFSLPIVFKWMDRDAVSPLRFYAAWWVMGLLPVVYELLDRQPWGRRVQSILPAAQAAPTVWYLALPYASLLLHLGILHWVYDTTFYGAHAAPVLIGLTIVLGRVQPMPFVGRGDLLVVRALLPAAAVLVSLNNPAALSFMIGDWLPVTPRVLAFAGAYLAYVYCFLPAWALPMLAAGAAAMLLHLFGPTMSEVSTMSWRAYAWSRSLLVSMVPKTRTTWGVIGVIASFVFLAMGAAVSLLRRPAR